MIAYRSQTPPPPPVTVKYFALQTTYSYAINIKVFLFPSPDTRGGACVSELRVANSK